MRVSVALCTHQGERWIEEQLRSILAQTVPVAEIVVGDDASTDRTPDIVRALAAETDVPIRIRHHAVALGVAGNFADAIAATTGDVVALSDQDDVWHPDRLERLLPHLDGVALVHSDARLVDADGAPLGATLADSLEMSAWERAAMADGRAVQALLRRNLVTGATAIVRRDAAMAALPIPAGWIHDEWLAMCAALGGGVRFVGSSFGDDANTVESGAYTLVDLALRYAFTRSLSLTAGVDNAFDRYPTRWDTTRAAPFPQLGFTHCWETCPFGINGRTLYARATYAF